MKSEFCRRFSTARPPAPQAVVRRSSVRRGVQSSRSGFEVRAEGRHAEGRTQTMEQITPQPTLETTSRPAEALTVRRLFTQPGVHPFDAVEWELRTAAVGSFRQDDVEFPKTWSQNATNIVAQKYFRGQLNSPTRERSVKQMVSRVSGTIADWGR